MGIDCVIVHEDGTYAEDIFGVSAWHLPSAAMRICGKKAIKNIGCRADFYGFVCDVSGIDISCKYDQEDDRTWDTEEIQCIVDGMNFFLEHKEWESVSERKQVYKLRKFFTFLVKNNLKIDVF